MPGEWQKNWGEGIDMLQGELEPLRSSTVLLCALEPVLAQQTLTRACLQRGFMIPSKLGVIPTVILVLFITWDHPLVFWLFRKRKHERKAYFLFLSYILVWTGCALEAWVFPPLFNPQRSFHLEINHLCESAPWANWFQPVVSQTWPWLSLSIPEDATPTEDERAQQPQIKDWYRRGHQDTLLFTSDDHFYH